MWGKVIIVHPLITYGETEAQFINLFLFIPSLPAPMLMARLPSLGCRNPVQTLRNSFQLRPVEGNWGQQAQCLGHTNFWNEQ